MMKIIDTYKDSIEAAFGELRFEIGVRSDGKLNAPRPRMSLLTEDQAIFVATLLGNYVIADQILSGISQRNTQVRKFTKNCQN